MTLTRGACACLVAGSLMASSCGKRSHSALDGAGTPGAGAVSDTSSGAAGEAASIGGASPAGGEGGTGKIPGGAAGEAEGGSSVGGAANGPCVDVSHVSARQTTALRTIGSGFEAYEGQMIRIVATVGKPYYGLGEAPIEGGSFDILLPGVLTDYTELGVYVDTIRDDACEPGDEILWQRATGPASAWGPGLMEDANGVVVWQITPNDLTTFEQAGPCNINGNFDAANRLRCPAQ